MILPLALTSDGYWIDRIGVAHICERVDSHGGSLAVWTLCGLDVPGRTAPTSEGTIHCLACRRVERRTTGHAVDIGEA